MREYRVPDDGLTPEVLKQIETMNARDRARHDQEMAWADGMIDSLVVDVEFPYVYEMLRTSNLAKFDAMSARHRKIVLRLAAGRIAQRLQTQNAEALERQKARLSGGATDADPQ